MQIRLHLRRGRFEYIHASTGGVFTWRYRPIGSEGPFVEFHATRTLLLSLLDSPDALRGYHDAVHSQQSTARKGEDQHKAGLRNQG